MFLVEKKCLGTLRKSHYKWRQLRVFLDLYYFNINRLRYISRTVRYKQITYIALL